MVRPSRNVRDGFLLISFLILRNSREAIMGRRFVVFVMVYDLILGTVIAWQVDKMIVGAWSNMSVTGLEAVRHGRVSGSS